MKIVTWNVNGSRARLKAGLEDSLAAIGADIVCLQETRARPDQLPKSFLEKYVYFFSLHSKPGYAGTAIFISNKNLPAPVLSDDFPNGTEGGRVAIAEFPDFVLISTYSPNSGQKLEKLGHRIEWEGKLAAFVKAQTKPVILCGDFNCAPTKQDTNCPTVKSGCSIQERKAFANLEAAGLVDIWRSRHPEEQQYTWFSNTYDSREANRGMRIDGFLISQSLVPLVENCEIIHDKKITADSDHNPVVLTINLGGTNAGNQN